MNQSQQIMEELRDVAGFPDLSMWKNPTKEEMKNQVPADVRGFVLPLGDIFMANVSKITVGLHKPMLDRAGGVFPEYKRALAKLNKEISNRFDDGIQNEFGITIHRLGDSMVFVLGDSEGALAQDVDQLPMGARPRVVNVKKHLRAAKKKMPHIKFKLPGFFAGVK